jgi:hypothetical protein
MDMPCRTCSTSLRAFEVSSPVFLTPGPAVQAALETDPEFDFASPRWLCRYVDGYPCFNCRTVDLAVADLPVLLADESRDLANLDEACPACRMACRGPWPLECEGVPGTLLAYLGPQFGSPLWARLCPSCGRVWLRLHPEDAAGRAELARRRPDGGACPACDKGRLRVTPADIPHSGFARLMDSSSQAKGDASAGAWPAGIDPTLLVAVCDVCGEATTRLGPSRPEE